jgi:plastocyanin
MTRARTGVVVGLAVAALALAGCGGGDDEASGTTDTETTTTETTSQTGGETGMVLKGSVGPGFEISLTTEDGQPVEMLAPGSYTLLTDDQSDIHNFHLTGDGVDVSTDVGSTGTDSFDITVTSGTYTFVCDPHSSTMNGSFEVSG